MQIGPEVEEAARTCGAAWLRMYWKVVLPLLAPTAVTVGLITFLSAVYDISTPVLLYNAGSRPLSILMLEYSFSGARERGAAIGVLLTVAVMLILLASRSLGYRLSRERL
jgi:iron(III) transport system permease protein